MMINKLLNRHQNRRNNGIPTISVLTGPVGISMYHWRKWAESYQRKVIFLYQSDIKAFVTLWIMNICRERFFYNHSLAFIANRIGENLTKVSTQISQKTKFEMELFFQQAFRGGMDDTELICRYIIEKEIDKTPPKDIADEILHIFGKEDSQIRTFIATTRIISDHELPAIMLSVKDRKNNAAFITNASKTLEKIALVKIDLPISLAIHKSDYNSFLKEAPETRSKALCKESVIQIEGLQTENINTIIGISPQKDRPSLIKSIDCLASDGATEELINDFKKAASYITDQYSDDIQLESKARSAAEQFLFNRLETLPETHGVFELNAKLDFKFGSKWAETDLVSKELKLAVEIDGYYHFKNSDSFRNDRLKDLTLQKHGYMVMRFLATDVVERLEHILETIKEMMKFRTYRKEGERDHDVHSD
jgi:hypothetical protein